jgi:heme-degrading monooxygenase HmoA
MFARSSTIAAQKSSLDTGIAFGDELMGQLLDIDGCVGMSLLVDRETGRCVATSSWQSQEAMHASESRVPPLRTRLMTAFGATDIQNDEWEVAVMHRDHRAPEGAHARVTYLRGDPARADESSEIFRSLLPELEDFPGFCSASLLLNRDSGRAVSNVIFDSADALARSAERATRLRAGAAERMGSQIVEVAEFELAYAHLRVPELV